MTPEEFAPYQARLDALLGMEQEFEEGSPLALELAELVDLALQHERDLRGSCSVCAHYKPDPAAGRAYFGEDNEYSGWCMNPVNVTDGKPFSMMCGDWCQSFERATVA